MTESKDQLGLKNDGEAIALLQSMINESESIVFFGGAGVSTESGIPDFRSVDGLYHQKYNYPPEEMLSFHFYIQHPEEFYNFYRDKMLYLDAQPNRAHLKLAELEKAGKLTGVITQNIDGLHQKAGSQNVLELHGSVHRNRCSRCRKHYDIQSIVESQGIPRCSCGGMIKPEVVLYEETLDPNIMEAAQKLIRQADMLIIGGTSLSVYPAAFLATEYMGNKLVVINRAIQNYQGANLVIAGSIGEVLNQITVA